MTNATKIWFGLGCAWLAALGLAGKLRDPNGLSEEAWTTIVIVLGGWLLGTGVRDGVWFAKRPQREVGAHVVYWVVFVVLAVGLVAGMRFLGAR